MEFRDYLRDLRAYRRWIIAIIAIVVIATALGSYLRPASYDTSLSFTVERVNKQETADYQFDGYYEIQASDLFSQTVISWFLTPSVLFDVYARANLDPEIGSIDRFANRFKTRKYSPQNIVVRFKENRRDDAEKLANAIIGVVEEKSTSLNRTDQGQELFRVVGETPVIVEQKSDIFLNSIIALIAGVLFSLVAVAVIRYLREDQV